MIDTLRFLVTRTRQFDPWCMMLTIEDEKDSYFDQVPCVRSSTFHFGLVNAANINNKQVGTLVSDQNPYTGTTTVT